MTPASRIVAALALLLLAAPGLGAVQTSARSPRILEIGERSLAGAPPAGVAAGLEAAAPGRWSLEWDRAAGIAGRGVRGRTPQGPDVSAARISERADDFLEQVAPLLGATVPLHRVRLEPFGRAWHVTWQQEHAGQPVFGATLNLVLSSFGEVVAFRSTLVPGLEVAPARLGLREAVDAASRALERPVRFAAAVDGVATIPQEGGLRGLAAVKLDLWSGFAERWEVLVDAARGEVLEIDSRLCEAVLRGTASSRVPPLYAHDTPVPRPLPWLTLELGALEPPLRSTADGSGRFLFEHPAAGAVLLRAGLEGSFVQVVRDGLPSPGFSSAVVVPGEIGVDFGDAEADLDERTIYVHTNVVHDFVATRFGFRLLDFALPAVAGARNPANGDPDYANAYWDGDGIHFGNGGSAFYNFGLFADVIYHEYTHAITEYMYRPLGRLGGVYGGGIHEALADYFACTITNDPEVGENLFRDAIRPHLRTLENNLHWPEDATYEAHADGEIFGGALWDLRRLVGPTVADPLVHFARAHGPRSYETYVNAILLEDDLEFGDAQAANGSPHREAILTAFGSHGFGPGAGSGRRLVHSPLHDTEDSGRSRRVVAAFDGTLSSAADTLYLHYAPGETFDRAAMERRPDGSFEASIPGELLPEGATIRYYIEVAAHRRVPEQTHPPGAPDTTHVFRVGPDREPPRIVHVPISSSAALAWPSAILALVDDNLGVAHAYVEFTRNGVPEASLGMVRAAEDPSRFTAQFPHVGGLGDVIEYRIVATDGSRSRLQSTAPESGAFRFEIVAELRETFDSGSGAWQHASLVAERADPWHWTPTENHTPGGSHALRCGSMTGEYPPSVAAALVTEQYPIGSGARARIWSRIDAETNGPLEAFDGGVVQLELDGSGEWQTLAPEGGYTHVVAGGAMQYLAAGTACLSGRDPDWRELRFDLASFAGHRVRLRFLFASDPVATPFGLGGWVIDDFDLDPGTVDPTDAALPAAGPHRLLSGAPAPNPFNPSLRFALRVPVDAGPVRLVLFDARGRRARTLYQGAPAAGPMHLLWDGTGERGVALPSGVYYYRLDSRFGSEQGSVVLVR